MHNRSEKHGKPREPYKVHGPSEPACGLLFTALPHRNAIWAKP